MKHLKLEEQAVLLQNALGCTGITATKAAATVILKTYNLLILKGDQFNIKDAIHINSEVEKMYETKDSKKH